jgi:Flp pilus assembly pilin Flp
MQKELKGCRQQRGASMVEYAILVALLSLFVLAGIRAMGNNFNQSFSLTSEAVKE